MPLFSEHISNIYYGGSSPSYSGSSSSYSAPSHSYSASPIGMSYSASYLNPGSSYSKHSSLGSYSRAPLTPRWNPSGRNYSPLLSTISERSTSSPVRIGSPRRIPLSKRPYVPIYTPRPININTADIDVSKDRYRPKQPALPVAPHPQPPLPPPPPPPHQPPQQDEAATTTSTSDSSAVVDNGPFMPRVDGKPETGIDTSPGLHRNTTIKRGRTVVRLHTIKRKDRDSPRKPDASSEADKESGSIAAQPDESETSQGWREKLADDLVYKDTRERKTLGEKLVEKFLVKDKNDDEMSDVTKKDSSKTKDDDVIENLFPPIVKTDNRSPDRRCSMELFTAQANVLDSLIKSENLSIATLDLTKIGTEELRNDIKNIPSIKRKKSSDQENPLQTTKSDYSLHDRMRSFKDNRDRHLSKKRSLRKSSSGSSLGRLDSITEFPKELSHSILPAIEENRKSIKKVASKPNLKAKITGTVEVSSRKSPLKFIVDEVTVEEKCNLPKREISYESVIDEVPIKSEINVELKSSKTNISDDFLSAKRYNTRSKSKTLVPSDNEDKNLESDTGNFWEKIGKRETVYLLKRKQYLEEEKQKHRRAFFWNSEDNDSENTDEAEHQESKELLSKSERKESVDISSSYESSNEVVNKTVIPGEVAENMQSVEENVIYENKDKNDMFINKSIDEDIKPIFNEVKQESIATIDVKNNRLSRNTDKPGEEVLISKEINSSLFQGNIDFDTENQNDSVVVASYSKNNDSEKPETQNTDNVLTNTNVTEKRKTLVKMKNIFTEEEHNMDGLTKTTIVEKDLDSKISISSIGNDSPRRSVHGKRKTLEKTKPISMNDDNDNKESKTSSKSEKEGSKKIVKKKILEKVQKVSSDDETKKNSSNKSSSRKKDLEPKISASSSDPKMKNTEQANADMSLSTLTEIKIVSVTPESSTKTSCPVHGDKKIIQDKDFTARQPKHNIINKTENLDIDTVPNEPTEIHLEMNDIPEIKCVNQATADVSAQDKKEGCDKAEKPAENKSPKYGFVLPHVKPAKQEAAVRPLIATPRPLQKKVPQVIQSSSSSESSSEEESSDDDDADKSNSSEGSGDFYECENHPDGRTSTGSNDSGFDSSAPASPAGFTNIKKGGETPGTSSAGNAEHAPGVLEQELEASTAYGIFRKTGRFTPPAKTIPRFRKYNIEDFHFIKVLGKGSFGKVLLAELRETEYYYAVKCLKKDVVLEDDDVECTLIERKVLALGTNHPYLCHLFATFQTDSHLFFVMEYLNGGDLMFHIQQSGRFPEDRARFYAAEIVSGLKFLHKRGIVYRDLKLDNILLDYEGHVRIADFGMCKLQIFLEKTADTFCGTPDYMAPEIIKGLKYNQTVDWWSFGVLLYEMLIGQSPFSGCDEDELFWSICNEMPSYPRFLSQNALTILTRLLDKDARTRLGGTDCMHGDVRDQDFFHSVPWDRLEARQLDPPFKPKVRHPLDTQYFDRAFTGEKPRLTAVEPQVLRSMDQAPFRGFSYTNPNATDR